ncbi:haloacid dehalogenase superfamily, subfamily IA, variant 1 [Longilinea arvoryzae]|uniref:Haloacid dehalogenase superfamily, subfamily IA, variant 1 n=1 Tax=Longilinea arvoryzae TaxID=360412 RepID=A0A0S7BEU1_9CHLR|nr:HAD family hydrolase [Longilinea arvoryzae]GAP12568.1 haloacid dehalogenase superfamily, subfamily IA, variant 1 [Longilinea arvoryzae]
MAIRVIFFDFGYVLATPTPGLDPRYLYLDWDGMARIAVDPLLAPYLRPGVGPAELSGVFERDYFQRFISLENGGLIVPRSSEILRGLLPKIFSHALNGDQYERLLSHIDTMKYMRIDPAAGKVLRALTNLNFKLGIISNMMLPGALLERLLQSEGLRGLFGPVIVSSETGYLKPHPRIFEYALDAGGWKPEEALFVGDTYKQDVVGARSVGMRVIWLNSRNEPTTQAGQNPPDAIIHSLEELLEADL